MISICGADCGKCEYGKNIDCRGCQACGCAPFGKSCFIAKYIKAGGTSAYEAFKRTLIDEFNSLKIDGMPKVTELYACNGVLINAAYPLPNGKEVKLLDDNEIYLGTQLTCEFDDGGALRYFGIAAGLDFLLVSEYGAGGENPQIVLFKRR